MEILAGIGAISNAISIAKTLRSIDKSYDTAQLRAQLAELLDQLTDAKLSLIEAKELLASKDADVQALKSSMSRNAELAKGDGDYQYILNEQGEMQGLPCCPRCLEVDRKIIQLNQTEAVDGAKCTVCQNDYRPVTRYIPASQNNGHATTAVEQWQARQQQKIEARRQRSIEMNRGRNSWMRQLLIHPLLRLDILDLVGQRVVVHRA